MSFLVTRGLTKKYGDFTAVDAIDLEVKQGEIFGLLGPNGAGKTTTINMLTGMAKITSGSVVIDGTEYTFLARAAQSIMGVVPDESNLYDDLSGFENLSFCGSLYGMRKREREAKALELLEKFGLRGASDKPFKSYSKGMKRKLTIAAGIIHNPKMLFLDEPTTGIDVASAREIRKLITELNRRGTTVFLTTHYIEEAERLCHRIAFMVNGRIIRVGSTEELMQEAQKENIVQFTLDQGLSKIGEDIRDCFPDVTTECLDDSAIRIHSDQSINLMPFMQFFTERGMTVREAKIIRPSLEDVFVKVTGIELAAMKKEKEKRGRNQ